MKETKEIMKEISSDELLKEIYTRFISKPIVMVSLPLNAELYYFFLGQNNIEILGGCDAGCVHNEKEFHNIVFTSLQECVERYGCNVNYFIICRRKYWWKIVQQLVDRGISTDQCFTNEVISNPFFRKSYTLDQLQISAFGDEIQRVYEALEDNLSKEVYTKILQHRFSDNSYQVLHKLAVFPQYYQTEILNFTDDEVYIDGGVLDGETINEFIAIVGGKYKEIYGMEINPQSSKECVEKFKGEPRITIIPKGLFDEDIMVKAEWNNTYNSALNSKGSEWAEVMKGDSLNVKATFIKMDIEGAELSGLRGFQNTIKMYRPKLAICIYHKLEDLWEIPLYIKKLVPEYKLYVRHHSTFGNLYETVLYATV